MKKKKKKLVPQQQVKLLSSEQGCVCTQLALQEGGRSEGAIKWISSSAFVGKFHPI